jgi:hypothetical protein
MSPRAAQNAAERIRKTSLLGVVFILAPAVIVVGWLLRPHPTQKAITEIPAAERKNLIFKEGCWFQLPGTNAFTGRMVEYYPDQVLCSRSAISNGLLNGVSEGWYTNGQLQIREHYQGSVANGLRQKWYENGQLKSEVMIVDGRLEGTFRSWHENGRLAEQIEMKHGQPDGEALAFYRSGFVKAETRVVAGKVLNQRTWDDGQHQPASGVVDDSSARKVN